MTMKAITEDTQRVRDAIAATPSDYLASTIAQRSQGSGGAAGSIVPMDPKELEATLNAATWDRYLHDAIKSPAVGFATTDIGGSVGVVELARLDRNPVLIVDDAKGTGFASLLVKEKDLHGDFASLGGKPWAHFTVALLGPDDDGKEILWTFHPGEPISPSTIPMHGLPSALRTKEALRMGFKHAKVVGKETA